MVQAPAIEHGHEGPANIRPISREKIASWLMPDEIIFDVELSDRRQVLEAAAVSIARRHQLESAPIYRALWRRELVGSTALGHGVAIPHARIDGLDHPITVFVRPKLAVDFHAPDGKPVRAILAILVPATGDTDEHLALLAQVGEMFADVAFRERLAYAGSNADVTKTFSDWTSRAPTGSVMTRGGFTVFPPPISH